ncbi:MAG: hypothetical protein H0V82_01715 [Candidatus Protochlamydia sp.]|nr:hypothetical protein [Candidatus Protochlamydia sp.]
MEIDDFPIREERLITAWLLIDKNELFKCWQALKNDKNTKLNFIAPLK